MSKGPGKWQQAILEHAKKVDYFYLIDLLPEVYDRNDYKALHRAAHQLAKAGKIYIQNGRYQRAKLYVSKNFIESIRMLEFEKFHKDHKPFLYPIHYPRRSK